MLGKEGPAGRLSLGASEAVMPRIPSERRDCEGGTRSLKEKSPKLLMETRIKLPQDFLPAPMGCSSCCLVGGGVLEFTLVAYSAIDQKYKSLGSPALDPAHTSI